MESLQRKHRQEQKDLQARITHMKKSATKKTRKGVNDECSRLERELKEQQDCEVTALSDEPGSASTTAEGFPSSESPAEAIPQDDVDSSTNELSISSESIAPSEPSKKPNRQKARLARRVAEKDAAAKTAAKEAADLPSLREQEQKVMQAEFASRGFTEKEIRSDGHCLYAAVADQLATSELDLKPRFDIEDTRDATSSPGYKITRQVAASYISMNADDFLPFLEEPLEEYTKRIRDSGEWGGHLELMALAKSYGVNINVLQGDGKVQRIECGSETTNKTFWLAYYRHNFGLGEHYNSLHKAA